MLENTMKINEIVENYPQIQIQLQISRNEFVSRETEPDPDSDSDPDPDPDPGPEPDPDPGARISPGTRIRQDLPKEARISPGAENAPRTSPGACFLRARGRGSKPSF